jgi:IS5 family transposase
VTIVVLYYPKGEQRRPLVGLERTLRLYLLQHWFNLFNPGLEDALYEFRMLRLFAGTDSDQEPVPDETTILNVRHLLKKHDLGRAMLNAISEYLAQRGVRILTETVVDATSIHAPISTKN